MTVAESYAYCERVARERARNFYYSFVLLPAARRKAICAMYAFMRYCDDVSDDSAGAERAARIADWRAQLESTLAGKPAPHPVWPAFLDAVDLFAIPHRYFFEMIDGVSSDLEFRPIRTFDELYRYCYQVAGVVGLTIIHIFGFESPEAPALAEQCGVAFQITNILRDVKEDADLGRIYLPGEDIERFRVSPEMLTGSEISPPFVSLMKYEAARAESYFRASLPLIGMVAPESRSSMWALIEIYRRLLGRIERAGYDVLKSRIRVPGWEKAWIVAQAYIHR